MHRAGTYILLILFFTSGLVSRSYSDTGDLREIIASIDAATKVEQLYTCRSNLARIDNSNSTNIKELELWCEAYTKACPWILAAGNHF